MEKKYELTNETKEHYGHILHRIRALRDFGSVKAGDLGGWIEDEQNLSHEGTCWVGDEALVCEEARVYGEALIFWRAWVYGRAEVCGEARVCGEAVVYGKAQVYGAAVVYGEAIVYGEARVYGEAEVHERAIIYGEAIVYGEAQVCGKARVCGKASIYSGTISSTNDYICIGPIGSRNDFTTFFKDEGKIMVKCGCFKGDIEEFKKAVEETHGENKYAKQYMAAMLTAEYSF